jgi:hypothetical protein
VKIAACYPEVQHSRQILDLLTPNCNLNQPFVKLPLASPATSSSLGTPNLVNCGDLTIRKMSVKFTLIIIHLTGMQMFII